MNINDKFYNGEFPFHDIRGYFEKVTNLENKSIIDFGCNNGNYLKRIEHDGEYTGVDIDKEIIEQNRKKWPKYNWIYYDGFNEMFNPNGKELIPELEFHDIAISFGVAVHSKFKNLKYIIETLKNISNETYIGYFSTKNREAYDLIRKFRNIDKDNWPGNVNYFYLKHGKFFWAFYDDDWLASKLNCDYIESPFKNDSKHKILSINNCLIFKKD